MAASSYLERLSGPIEGESPGGVDLEAASSAIMVLAGKGIIGQQTGIRDPDNQDWRTLRKDVLGSLDKSRDLRLLPYLSAAVARSEDLAAFLSLFDVARAWLEGFATGVHPLPEEDFNPRLNALADWQDAFAVLEPLRRLPFLGSDLSLRVWLVAHGEIAPAADEDPGKLPGTGEIEGTLRAADQAVLADAVQALERALESIRQIEILVSPTPGNAGTHGDLGRISSLLTQIHGIVAPELERRTGGVGMAAAGSASAAGGEGVRGSGGALGAINSRADALRALSEVQKFFAATEPSSPVPLLVERVKRLIDRSFLEVLEELLPDRVGEAKNVAGVRDS